MFFPERSSRASCKTIQAYLSNPDLQLRTVRGRTALISSNLKAGKIGVKIVYAEAEILHCVVSYMDDLHQRAEFVLFELRAKM